MDINRPSVFFAMPKTGSGCMKRMIKKSNKVSKETNKIKFIPHYSLPESFKEIKRCRSKNVNMFCFVRNPFSRLVSAYNYLKNGGRRNKVDLDMQKIVLKYSNFSDFCFDLKRVSSDRNAIHFYPQHKWIYDEKMYIEHIGRYENFMEDYKRFSDLFKFPFIWTDKRDSNVLADRKDYIKYYHEDTIKVVVDFYKKDFELFGYSKELKCH